MVLVSKRRCHILRQTLQEVWPCKIKKGEIKENYDADILLIDEKFEIKFVVAKGEILKDDSGFIKKGTYE